VDTELQTSVPASLVTYRSLVRSYPSNPAAEAAYEALSERYKDVRQFALAAESLEQLATHFPENRRDAAWRAGELYEDKVKDPAKARGAYALVPPTSPRTATPRRSSAEIGSPLPALCAGRRSHAA
jgi:hypothetical protein